MRKGGLPAARGSRHWRRGATACVALASATAAIAGTEAGATTERSDAGRLRNNVRASIVYAGEIRTERRTPTLWNPLKTRLAWNLVWSGTVGQLRSGDPVFTVLKLSGTISAKYRNAANQDPSPNCFGTLSRNPSGRTVVLWSEPSGGSTVQAGARPPFGPAHIRSSALKSTVCGNPTPVLDVAQATSDSMSVRVGLRTESRTTSVSRTFNVSYNGALPGTRVGRAVDSMKSTITLTLGARRLGKTGSRQARHPPRSSYSP